MCFDHTKTSHVAEAALAQHLVETGETLSGSSEPLVCAAARRARRRQEAKGKIKRRAKGFSFKSCVEQMWSFDFIRKTLHN